MKEKLIIKNFGPIKNVELDLGRFNVLIGDQGTGKSTVARLLNLLRYDYFIKDLYQKKAELIVWLNDYDINHLMQSETEIYYETEYFFIKLKKEKVQLIVTDTEFEKLLLIEVELLKELGSLDILNEKIRHINISNSLTKNDSYLGAFIGEVSFIPTERILLSYLVSSAFSLNKVIETLPNYIRNAGKELEIFKLRIEKEKINIDIKSIVGADVSFYYSNNIAKIKKGTKDFLLTQAESGIQSLVPLLIEFEAYKNYKRLWSYIIEEPELNLFPTAQYNLIKYLFSSINSEKNRNITITTHSPYILASLNNLIEAYKSGQINDEQTNKIIERRYWINPNDVSSYMMLTDGYCEDIFDREEGLIKSEKIDGVTNILNEQFTELLNLEFASNEFNS